MYRNVLAFFQSAAFALFAGTLLSDWAYWRSGEIQWINFASWLLFGGAVLAGLSLLTALVPLAAKKCRHQFNLLHALLLIALVALATLNSFVHARDAWASMPNALTISAVTVLLSLVCVVIGFNRMSSTQGAGP